MTLAQARAMVGMSVHVEEFDPGAERAALQRLARWSALRFSPIVSVDPCTLAEKISADDPLPDGIVMDITGCERLFDRRGGERGGERGERALAMAMLRSLARAGFEARIGIAPTIGAAWAAARFGDGGGSTQRGESPGPVTIFSSNYLQLRRQLEPLHVRALRIEARTVQSLVELGLERIGQVLDLQRMSLPSRFGPLLVRRIDQALGSAIETIEPVRPRPPVRVERVFEGPTPQIEAVELCTRELLIELSGELLRRESGVRLLEAVFERIGRNGRGTEELAERLTLSRPSRDPRHLWSLLRPKVEKLHLGYGIESITLTALRTGKLRHKQGEYVDASAAERRQNGARGVSPGSEDAPTSEARRGGTSSPPPRPIGQHEGELIDTLANRLGHERVLKGELTESHIPERAFRLAPAVEDPVDDAEEQWRGPSAKAPRAAPSMKRRLAARESHAAAHPAPSSRPTLLFDHPEPAEAIALAPDRPPTILRWRGEERRLVAGFGPERLAGEWWRVRARAKPGEPAGDAWERDYFRVCDEAGHWLWVYREMPLYRAQDVPRDAAGARPVRWFVHGLWT